MTDMREDRAGAGPRILLVEDEPANRALVRAILTRAPNQRFSGLELFEAGSIAEARALLARCAVDIALLDVRLPDGNGLDLAADIRSSGPKAPGIVIISASVLPAERSMAAASRVGAFLAKPFRAAELLDLVEGLLGTTAEARAAD